MDCKNCLDLIEDLVEGEIDRNTSEEVFMHVFACQNCEAKFESLQNEKEIYSRFLFEIEPPKDLTQKFAAKLAAEFPIDRAVLAENAGFGERLKSLFSAWKLTPIALAACVLLMFAFGHFRLENTPHDLEKTLAATAENSKILTEKKKSIQIQTNENEISKERVADLGKSTPQNLPASVRSRSPLPKIVGAKPKVGLTKNTNVRKSLPLNSKPKDLINLPMSKEQQAKIEELQNFDAEIAKQAEKTEMLLRSFRNSSFSEETKAYDISYEKQQARKLLQTNALLRERAQIYGAFFALDTLEKAEPHLLDIANLDAHPSPMEVLDIKQRMRNQNVIASLQGF